MEWIELGRIGAAFGVKGWMHVESYTDPPARLLDYPDWMVRNASGERRQRRVAEGRLHSGRLVARLEGVQDRQEVEAFKGAHIEVARSELPPPGEREYYRADLIGLEVHTREGAVLGVLRYFVDAPTGAMMVVQSAAGRDHWVPAIPRYVWKVELAAGRMVVDWSTEPQA